jgi:hypothetical protein
MDDAIRFWHGVCAAIVASGLILAAIYGLAELCR